MFCDTVFLFGDCMKDIIIIGAGPAGLTSAIYAVRAGCDVLIFESISPGGQLMTTPDIENYPGFTGTGFDLSLKMHEQAVTLGVNFEFQNVKFVEKNGDTFKVICESGVEYETRCVIVASGAKRRLLDIEGEKRLTGYGVSYCASCDGNFFKNKTAVVIGGGNTAVEDAIYLSNICEKVYLVHRRDSLRASSILQDSLFSRSNVEILYSYIPLEIGGEKTVENIILENTVTKDKKIVETDAVFVAIGTVPEASFVPQSTKRDNGGYIITDNHCLTNIEGLYAVGDVRNTPLKQVITAAADGAVAATYATEYLRGKV